jgi:hypothetical protein
VAARISKFPELKAELSRCPSQGVYIWQYSRCPAALPTLPTAPIAAAATADEVAPEREDAQFCWLAAPVPVASLPASFAQQAPTEQEGKVFASYRQLQGYQPDYSHAPSLTAKPGAGAAHTK